MAHTGKTIGKRSAEWLEQLARIKLPRTLLKGTEGMRAAGEEYLPKQPAEPQPAYDDRLKGAALINKFEQTLNYHSGQVFQKPVKYTETPEGEEPPYDEAFFNFFKEDVDRQGTSLSMFCEQMFREGETDGVSFVLTDYSKVDIVHGEQGELMYRDKKTGEVRPKTAVADNENGWRPYLVCIKAEQVLDAWRSEENGVMVLKEFRYVEGDERDNGDGTRTVISRIRAFFPDRWEVWEQENGRGEYLPIDTGTNVLGVVPVDWFIAGIQMTGLTAKPALETVAQLNRKLWESFADHEFLMRSVRRPPWFGAGLKAPGGDPIPFGVGILIDGPEGSNLQSIGIDPSAVANSLQDIKEKEQSIDAYGLQMVMPQTGAVTATQSGIAAASSDASLKGMVERLRDCMENALSKVAVYQGGTDGPAISINTEFRIAFDAGVVSQLSAQQTKGQISRRTLLETEKRMGIFDDDFDIDAEIESIKADAAEEPANMGYTPPFGSFPGGGGQNNNNQQIAPGAARS